MSLKSTSSDSDVSISSRIHSVSTDESPAREATSSSNSDSRTGRDRPTDIVDMSVLTVPSDESTPERRHIAETMNKAEEKNITVVVSANDSKALNFEGGDTEVSRQTTETILKSSRLPSSERSYHVFPIASYFSKLFNYGTPSNKKTVTFKSLEDIGAEGQEDPPAQYFDGECAHIPAMVEVPSQFREMTISASTYENWFCSLVYPLRKEMDFAPTGEPSDNYKNKQKVFSKFKEITSNFIRSIYWSPIQHILHVVDFQQKQRVVGEVGHVASKVWIFAFILNRMYETQKDLSKETKKKILEFWKEFLDSRERIWQENDNAQKCSLHFFRFFRDVYKIIKTIGRTIGLKIHIESAFFKLIHHGDGLQKLENMDKIDNIELTQLQFEEKISAVWYNFNLLQPEEQERFLKDLLEEAASDFKDVQVNVNLLWKYIISGKLEKVDTPFMRNIRYVKDCVRYFYKSPHTSLDDYHQLKDFVEELARELMELLNNVRYILLRAMEVCDVTELSAVYLSSKYEFLELKPKLYKKFCTKLKFYRYKEADYMQNYYREALISNSTLETKHCRLKLSYVKDTEILSENTVANNATEEKQDSEEIDEDACNLGITELSVSQEQDIAKTGTVSVSIYNYLESEKFKLKSILKRPSVVIQVVTNDN